VKLFNDKRLWAGPTECRLVFNASDGNYMLTNYSRS
jgi:hypothetical protein